MKTDRRRPGPAPRFSRDDVLAVARRLPRDRLTMTAIGSELGVTGPALYRYFPDRRALLSALADDVRRQVEPPDPSLPWRQWMRTWAQLDREMWRSHPELHDVAARASIGRAAIPALRVGMDILTGHGFTRADALHSLAALAHLSASYAQTERFGSNASDEVRAELDFIVEFLDEDPDEGFSRMVELILDGLTSRSPKAG